MALVRHPFLWLFVLSCCPRSCTGKFQTGTLRLSGPKTENHWKYLSKFGYGIGTGEFQVRLQLVQPKTLAEDKTARIQFNVYLDEDWPGVESMDEVCSRTTKSKQVREIELVSQGKWGAWVNGSLSQKMRPHIWFFAISDCKKVLQNFTHRVRYEARFVQDGGSEFSCEMSWMLASNTCFLLGFTVFCWHFGRSTAKFTRSAGSIHPVIWVLISCLIVQYVAQIFHWLHLWKYSYDGSGVKALEVLSEILFMLSQVLQTSLLILIALGYTLLQTRMGELDLMIPMCFMIGVIHVMLVGFGKIKDDASYKYHENEGAVGYILLAVRLGLYLWFLWAVNSSSNAGGMKLRSFLIQFRLAGSIYFLAYPAIFVVTKLFAPYLQHGVMSVGLMCMQLGSNAWLASLFLTRGEYFKVSSLSDSELPGGTKVGVMKDE